MASLNRPNPLRTTRYETMRCDSHYPLTLITTWHYWQNGSPAHPHTAQNTLRALHVTHLHTIHCHQPHKEVPLLQTRLGLLNRHFHEMWIPFRPRQYQIRLPSVKSALAYPLRWIGLLQFYGRCWWRTPILQSQTLAITPLFYARFAARCAFHSRFLLRCDAHRHLEHECRLGSTLRPPPIPPPRQWSPCQPWPSWD